MRLTGMLTGLVILIGCSGEPTGPNAILSPNEELAVAGWSDGNLDIYLFAGTRHPLRLTTDLARDFEPTWAPDGESFAFTSDRTGVLSVWVHSPDNVESQLTLGFSGAHHPAWSPDGTRIAFSYWINSQNEAGIATLTIDGSSLSVLYSEIGGTYRPDCPAWSLDGSRILFEAFRGVSDYTTETIDIWSMSFDDGSDLFCLVDPVSNDVHQPSYVDAGRLSYVEYPLERWDPPSQGSRILMGGTFATSFTGWETQPSWTSDGKRLAFAYSDSLPADLLGTQVYVGTLSYHNQGLAEWGRLTRLFPDGTGTPAWKPF